MKKIAVCADLTGVFLKKTPILKALSAHFEAGMWHAITGANGAGKTTLLLSIAGLLPTDFICEGVVSLEGENIHGLSARERSQKVAWLGQGEAGAMDWRVKDLVALGRLPHQSLWTAETTDTDKDAIEQALQATQITEFSQRCLSELSAGQIQRVRLARALATQAPLLLLDEPLSQLDLPHQMEIAALLKKLALQGSTIISVMHELPIALLADEMLMLKEGQIVHQGACHESSTHRALEHTFDHKIEVFERHGKHFVSGL